MKTKETSSQKLPEQKVLPTAVEPKVRPKSLRPMRSMVALRSFRPRTAVATVSGKAESETN